MNERRSLSPEARTLLESGQWQVCPPPGSRRPLEPLAREQVTRRLRFWRTVKAFGLALLLIAVFVLLGIALSWALGVMGHPEAIPVTLAAYAIVVAIICRWARL